MQNVRPVATVHGVIYCMPDEPFLFSVLSERWVGDGWSVGLLAGHVTVALDTIINDKSESDVERR